jgi:4'-phosphopantetheinyl transferase EntD
MSPLPAIHLVAHRVNHLQVAGVDVFIAAEPVAFALPGDVDAGALGDGARPPRAREYVAGRRLAMHGLAAFGLSGVLVGRGPDRRPAWPRGVVGSIAHDGCWTVVAVAESARVAGVGVDVERRSAVDPSLRAELLAPGEHVPDTLLAAVFCAKEAVYKAVNPLSQVFLEFADVAIEADPATRPRAAGRADPADDLALPAAGDFGARCLRAGTSAPLVAAGHGTLRVVGGSVLALFVIPAW